MHTVIIISISHTVNSLNGFVHAHNTYRSSTVHQLTVQLCVAAY